MDLLAGFLVAVLAFYLRQMDDPILVLHANIQAAALHAATWGCVSGILRGLWYLKEQVSDRRYMKSLQIYYISVPFLGALVYFLLVAGLFVIASTQAVPILVNSAPNAMTHPNNASTQSPSTANNASTQSPSTANDA